MKLHFASKLSDFLPALLADYRSAAAQAWSDSLSAPVLIAGTPLVQRYLVHRIAEHHGMMMGLQVQRLEGALWSLLQKPAEMQMLTVDTLEPLVLDLLHELAHSPDPFWQGIAQYLRPKGSIETEKWVQFAKKWARAFLEYELNRPGTPSGDPGLLGTWQRGKSYFESLVQKRHLSHAQHLLDEEKVQMEFWRLLLPRIQSELPNARSLAMLWEENRRMGFPLLQGKKQKWSVVGLPGLSHFHRNALLEISSQLELQVYLLNPCAEYWEDVQTRRPMGYKRTFKQIPRLDHSSAYESENLEGLLQDLGQDSADLMDFEDQKLLQLWGAADRENLTLWGQLATDLEPDFKPEIPADNLLHTVQKSILERLPPDEIPRLDLDQVKGDHSLFLCQAPSLLREMQTLRDLALGMLDPEHPLYLPGLRPDEICLLLPDVAEYQVALEQSFLQGSSLSRLPVFVWKGAGQSSLVGEAIRSMTKLWNAEFNRAQVFGFLRLGTVLGKLKLDRSCLANWEERAAQLHIYRGYDRGHRLELGDHEALPIHTWQHAFDRMIAAWMCEHPLGEEGEILPYGTQREDPEDMALMISTVQNLYQSIQKIRQHCLSDSFDPELVLQEMAQWLDFKQMDAKEEQVWAQWSSSMRVLEGRSVSLDLLRSWSLNHLQEELEPKLSQYSGSLLIAPLKMGHVLPHKVLLMGGLGSNFPGQSGQSTMDLLKHCRILGDMDPIKNNQGAFLHALLAARDRLVLSYRHWDVQKDAELFPSSVLSELNSYVKNFVIDGESTGIPTLPLSLLARDAQNLHAQSMTYHYDKTLLEALQESAAPLNLEHRAQRSGDLSLRDLALFVRSPLEYRIKRGFGLYTEEQEDASIVEDEDLAWSGLERTMYMSQLAKNAWSVLALGQSIQPQELCDQLIHSLWHQGAMAESYFGQAQKEKLQGWAQTLLEWSENFQDWQFLDANSDFWEQYWPMSLESQGRCLHAARPAFALWREDSAELCLVQIGASKMDAKHRIHPWLEALWMGRQPGFKLSYAQLGIEGFCPVPLDLASDLCTQQLQFLLQAEGCAPLQEHLPLDVVMELSSPRGKGKNKIVDPKWTREDMLDYFEEKGPGPYAHELLNLIDYEIPSEPQETFAQRTLGFELFPKKVSL